MPDVWRMSSWTVTGFQASGQAARCAQTESSSFSFPASRSFSAAIDVNIFVIDATACRVSGVYGTRRATSAKP